MSHDPAPGQPITVEVEGDYNQEAPVYPEADVWYPGDLVCLRAEALVRLANVSHEVSPEVRDRLLTAMDHIVYTMSLVRPEIQAEHELIREQVFAQNQTKH